jgi:hypothetical protein
MSSADAFCRSAPARFINSSAGRTLRVIAGAALIWYGYTNRATTTGMVLMIVGFVPLIAGAFDLCFFAPLFGAPMSGAKVREIQQRP